MDIRTSARKHGITDTDIEHALRHIRVYREIEVDHELRLFVIGVAADGRLLEIVVVPAGAPQRVMHADALRPKFFALL